MTIEEALPYLKEYQQEITDRIYRGKYTCIKGLFRKKIQIIIKDGNIDT